MDPTRKEITFCIPGCGANMHYECMKSWKEQKSAAREAVTCPLCRHICPIETHEQSLHCPELDAVSFEYYQEWLYHRTIFLEDQKIPIKNSKVAERETSALIDAYLLGVRLRDRMFCKNIFKALIETAYDSNEMPSPELIHRIYHATEDKSRMRRFLVDFYITFAKSTCFEGNRSDGYPRKFMADVAMALLRRRNSEGIDQEWPDLNATYCIVEDGADEELPEADANDPDSSDSE
jgi:hypothetical protein